MLEFLSHYHDRDRKPLIYGTPRPGLRGQSKRLIQLEGARGIASIIVIFHHYSLAFFPQLKAPFWEGGLRYTPAYTLLNGSGAVTYFFLLSGFVLTLGFYRNFSGSKLLAASIKRLPRLMVPASVSILLGYLILSYFPTLSMNAAEFTGSKWLSTFGNAHLPQDHQPSIVDAMRQSLFVFLVPRDFYYNSNLWTMHNEFYGSLIVFGLVALSGCTRLNKCYILSFLHAIAFLVFAIIHHSFVPFVAGSYLAYMIQRHSIEIDVSSSIACMTVAVIGFSVENWLAHTIASILVMIVLLGEPKISSLLSGDIGKLLGTLSFPLYLVHTIVIVSFSSYVFSSLSDGNVSFALTQLFTIFVTIFLSLCLSLPFVILDKKWVWALNRLASQLLFKESGEATEK
ncbi:MAG: acyltransferase [Pseudoruegeria sp.]